MSAAYGSLLQNKQQLMFFFIQCDVLFNHLKIHSQASDVLNYK